MGVNGEGAGAITDFERAHLQQSFVRSLVAMAIAFAMSAVLVSAVFVALGYCAAFLAGRAVASRSREGKDAGVERAVIRVLAWDDVRPVLSGLAPFVACAWFASGAKAFADWVEEHWSADLLAEAGVAAAVEAFAGAASLGNPLFVLGAVWLCGLVAASGLTDGFWVGAVQSRAGVSFRETIPLGQVWLEWRRERRERRKVYLGGGG